MEHYKHEIMIFKKVLVTSLLIQIVIVCWQFLVKSQCEPITLI